MKVRLCPLGRLLITLAPLVLGTFLVAHGAAKRTNATRVHASATVSNTVPVASDIPQSVFVVPATPDGGKDPFFPRSTRAYATVAVAVVSNAPAPPVVDLKINGTSGSEDRPLVIINNETFGIGDSRDVISGGRRIPIKCVEIDLSAGRATVEVGGSRRTLFFQKSRK